MAEIIREGTGLISFGSKEERFVISLLGTHKYIYDEDLFVVMMGLKEEKEEG